ncbi:baseplate J/gp47 family protein [Paenibacillus sp. 481]|nr:baseplate J/gp47 family protein [Paenibacillus sp. 481]
MDSELASLDSDTYTPSFEEILNRMLTRVPDDVDKREGSIIYDALAPVAAELAQWYLDWSVAVQLSYADTATGEYLERRTAEFGVRRLAATAAKRRGMFMNTSGLPVDVPIGSRFSIGGLTFGVTERLSLGEFVLMSETVGTQGNQAFGVMTPIDYVDGLARAELGKVLVPGEDAEADEELRARYLSVMSEQPFGGNVADYKTKLNAIPGVGGVKVYPAWNGGGTVKCTLISSTHDVPSPEFVASVQTETDPLTASGKGIGFAPIGHRVTVAAVQPTTASVEMRLVLEKGITLGQVQADVEKVLREYVYSLRTTWKDADKLTVRVSQLEARALTVRGVTDVSGTKLNGVAGNLELGSEHIPLLGEVKLHAT